MDAFIANKLEIRFGSIMIPGCEPISELSSVELARNLKCSRSEIPVKEALALVPGSYVVRGWNIQYFVIPSGPPPQPKCPCVPTTDWYALLRNAVTPTPSSDQCKQAAFGVDWCCNDEEVGEKCQ